ncbi:MAG: hypothetical protein A2138_19730 [Deltaproteobacteria bacterium RBG_16_71_12]|nr:MAG: hypothetical protein A2138_19730 [Deltaproteobacteria bacterium RBG_16_71_12]
MKKRLGEILLERGLIDVDQLNSALAHQRQWGMRLGTALVAKGFIAEGMLTRVLAESLGIPMVDLARIAVDQKALQLVPRRIAEQYDVFPISVREQAKGRRLLLLAMADPLNATAIDEIGFTTDSIVKPAIAQISSLEQAIRRHYYGEHLDVAPLAMRRKGSADMHDDSGDMTILTGHGEERVISSRGDQPVLQLTDEVTASGGGQRERAPYEQVQPLPADYAGLSTGVFQMPTASAEGLPVGQADVISVTRPADLEDLEALEKKFWALMRILARRGLVTKEEFLAELRQGD